YQSPLLLRRHQQICMLHLLISSQGSIPLLTMEPAMWKYCCTGVRTSLRAIRDGILWPIRMFTASLQWQLPLPAPVILATPSLPSRQASLPSNPPSTPSLLPTVTQPWVQLEMDLTPPVVVRARVTRQRNQRRLPRTRLPAPVLDAANGHEVEPREVREPS